jgi:hypothetical protein
MRPSGRGRTATLFRLVVGYSVLGAAVSTALACPRCYTSELVRAAVFGPEFLSNLLAVSSPFLVLGSTALIVHRICRRLGSRRRTQR